MVRINQSQQNSATPARRRPRSRLGRHNQQPAKPNTPLLIAPRTTRLCRQYTAFDRYGRRSAANRVVAFPPDRRSMAQDDTNFGVPRDALTFAVKRGGLFIRQQVSQRVVESLGEFFAHLFDRLKLLGHERSER